MASDSDPVAGRTKIDAPLLREPRSSLSIFVWIIVIAASVGGGLMYSDYYNVYSANLPGSSQNPGP